MKTHLWAALAVLIAAALLAAILVPNFLRARGRGHFTPCQGNLKNIATALTLYSTDSAGRYPLHLDALAPGYLKALPTCPATGRASYGYLSTRNPKPAYTTFCQGRNHAVAGAPEDFPQYGSRNGLVLR